MAHRPRPGAPQRPRSPVLRVHGRSSAPRGSRGSGDRPRLPSGRAPRAVSPAGLGPPKCWTPRRRSAASPTSVFRFETV